MCNQDPLRLLLSSHFNSFPPHYHHSLAAAAATSLQSCPTLCDPIDGSPPGSVVLGILQARTLEWVAISFSNAWKWKVKVKLLSRVRLLATPWTAAYQAPPSMGFFQARVLEWGAIAFSDIYTLLCIYWEFSGGWVIKNSHVSDVSHRRWRFNPWVRKIPWRSKWQPTPVFLLV